MDNIIYAPGPPSGALLVAPLPPGTRPAAASSAQRPGSHPDIFFFF